MPNNFLPIQIDDHPIIDLTFQHQIIVGCIGFEIEPKIGRFTVFGVLRSANIDPFEIFISVAKTSVRSGLILAFLPFAVIKIWPMKNLVEIVHLFRRINTIDRVPPVPDGIVRYQDLSLTGIHQKDDQQDS